MPALPTPVRRRQPLNSRYIVWIFATLSLCASAYALWVSTYSFEALRGIALASIPPGYADRFTPGLYGKIILALRLLAFVLAVLAAVLVRYAEPVLRALKIGFEDLTAPWSELGRGLASLRRDPLHMAALAAILLWAIWLRCAFLHEPVRKDEAASFLYYASRPVFVGLAYYTANNHLLSTLLMHISTSAFGVSEWAMRLPTLIAGVLLVPATYVVVRLPQGKNAALLATALVSASSPLIEFSFNARGYSLGALFLLIMAGMIEFARSKGAPRAWISIAIPAALALYSVPTMLYGVGGAFLYMLLTDVSRWRSVYAMLLTGVLTLTFYTPAMVAVGVSGIVRNKWTAPLPNGQWMPQLTHELASLWGYWNLDVPRLASGLVIAGVLIALLFRKTLGTIPAAVFLCTAFVAAVLLPLQHVVPYRRTWLFLLPFYLGSAATGLSTVLQKARNRHDSVAVVLSLTLAGWLGASVLNVKSLRHSGLESVGGRSAEAVALGMRNRLAQGGQFICSDFFDSPIDFYLLEHKIRYSPTPNGELLIVTPPGRPPERTLDLAGIRGGDVQSMRMIARYVDADVYAGQRTAQLPFEPRGTTDTGIFTSIVR